MNEVALVRGPIVLPNNRGACAHEKILAGELAREVTHGRALGRVVQEESLLQKV